MGPWSPVIFGSSRDKPDAGRDWWQWTRCAENLDPPESPALEDRYQLTKSLYFAGAIQSSRLSLASVGFDHCKRQATATTTKARQPWSCCLHPSGCAESRCIKY